MYTIKIYRTGIYIYTHDILYIYDTLCSQPDSLTKQINPPVGLRVNELPTR